jgi:hypothetical protein
VSREPRDDDLLPLLVELLHRAIDRMGPYVGTYEIWQDDVITKRMNLPSLDPARRRAAYVRMSESGSPPRTQDMRAWVSPPSHLRVEIRDGGQLVSLLVRDDIRWARWEMGSGSVTGEHAASGTPAAFPPLLLDPAHLRATMRLQAIGRGKRPDAKPFWQAHRLGVMATRGSPIGSKSTARLGRYETGGTPRRGRRTFAQARRGDLIVYEDASRRLAGATTTRTPPSASACARATAADHRPGGFTLTAPEPRHPPSAGRRGRRGPHERRA